MHVFFSGIGGTGIGPLALIAKQAGYDVSGSDLKDSQYIEYLRSKGIGDIYVGQTEQQIELANDRAKIDWFVYSSALSADHPELLFCKQNGIKMSKRDELLNKIIDDKNLKLIAIAGTHGKTTTTAMAIWLLQNLNVPVSYSVGAKISFGDMGHFDEKSEFFVYECDEYDRNFLAFNPYMSLITGIDWDHHEVYLTRENYQEAFREFMGQSQWNIVWEDDVKNSNLSVGDNYLVLDEQDPILNKLSIAGEVNRKNAWQVIKAVYELVDIPIDNLTKIMESFPGLSRRFERIIPNLYSDYAHTVPKIKGCLQMAFEQSKDVVVIYEPLTNRRQHYIKDDYKNLFDGVKKLYWVPSYLAREDPSQEVLSPKDLIKSMTNADIAEPAELDGELKNAIQNHLDNDDLVVCLSGGGGGSLDEWLRANFVRSS